MRLEGEMKLKTYLENYAKRSTWSDNEDFNVFEYSGGNFEDAYDGGFDDGETNMAQTILNEHIDELL